MLWDMRTPGRKEAVWHVEVCQLTANHTLGHMRVQQLSCVA